MFRKKTFYLNYPLPTAALAARCGQATFENNQSPVLFSEAFLSTSLMPSSLFHALIKIALVAFLVEGDDNLKVLFKMLCLFVFSRS